MVTGNSEPYRMAPHRHVNMSFFRILVSHVDNAISLGDRWFHTLEYNTVITKCLNLIMFLGDSFQGICKQSHWTEQTGLKLLLRTSKAFSFTVTQGREGWLKIENIPRDYVPLTLLPILYLSHLSPNQVSDYFCFHPCILKWLRKKLSSKNKDPQRDWNISLNVLRK